MIAQMLRNDANAMLLTRQLTKKYRVSPETIAPRLKELSSEDLLELGERILECDSFEDIQLWIREKKQSRQ
jgi:DNA-binding transcriptional regulator YhcF (GntR family)